MYAHPREGSSAAVEESRLELARPRDGDGDARAVVAPLLARVAAARPDLDAGDEFLACAADAACELLARGALGAAAWREAVAPFFVMVDDGDAACEELRAGCVRAYVRAAVARPGEAAVGELGDDYAKPPPPPPPDDAPPPPAL